jgi:hypothetical protein
MLEELIDFVNYLFACGKYEKKELELKEAKRGEEEIPRP